MEFIQFCGASSQQRLLDQINLAYNPLFLKTLDCKKQRVLKGSVTRTSRSNALANWEL